MWEAVYSFEETPPEPEGWVWLPFAVEELLSVLGVHQPQIPLLDRKDGLSPKDAALREKVVRETEAVASRIGCAAAIGRLKFLCRLKSGGPFVQVPADHWGVNDFWGRMEAGAYNLEKPWDINAEPTHWLFVEERSWCWLADDVRITEGEQPQWQRAYSLDASPDEWPGPGPSETQKAAILARLGKKVAQPNKTTSDKTKRRANPGPPLDLDWRDQVFKYCRAVGRDAASRPSARMFLRAVKEFYEIPFGEKPVDYRRTDEWRQSWLDQQAGIGA